MYTVIQNNQTTRGYVSMCIHTRGRMPIWQLHNQNTATLTSFPQSTNVGYIHQFIEGVRQVKSIPYHQSTRKIWVPTEPAISDIKDV